MTITLTVDVDGNSVSREFGGVGEKAWTSIVEDMLDTIEKSKEEKF